MLLAYKFLLVKLYHISTQINRKFPIYFRKESTITFLVNYSDSKPLFFSKVNAIIFLIFAIFCLAMHKAITSHKFSCLKHNHRSKNEFPSQKSQCKFNIHLEAIALSYIFLAKGD